MGRQRESFRQGEGALKKYCGWELYWNKETNEIIDPEGGELMGKMVCKGGKWSPEFDEESDESDESDEESEDESELVEEHIDLTSDSGDELPDVRRRSNQRGGSEQNRVDRCLPVHGLQRGRRNGNEPGSFWISKKNGTVLSRGKFAGIKHGDQRWAIGLKGEEYCPTMRIIGTNGGIKHCVCQCS